MALLQEGVLRRAEIHRRCWHDWAEEKRLLSQSYTHHLLALRVAYHQDAALSEKYACMHLLSGVFALFSRELPASVVAYLRWGTKQASIAIPHFLNTRGLDLHRWWGGKAKSLSASRRNSGKAERVLAGNAHLNTTDIFEKTIDVRQRSFEMHKPWGLNTPQPVQCRVRCWFQQQPHLLLEKVSSDLQSHQKSQDWLSHSLPRAWWTLIHQGRTQQLLADCFADQ